MNNKKTLPIIIVVVLVVIGCGVGFYFWNNKLSNPQTQTQQSVSEPKLKSPKIDIKIPNKTKTEPEQTQFQITQANFDIVKAYILSEKDGEISLPNELTETEKNKIEELKQARKIELDFLKKQKNKIDEQQIEIDKLQANIDSITTELTSLNPQKNNLETQSNNKTTQIELKRQEIKTLERTHPDKKRLQEELDVLCKERITIVHELEQIRIKIGKLEAKKRMYSEQIELANNLKKTFEQNYNTMNDDSTITSLKAFYIIVS